MKTPPNNQIIIYQTEDGKISVDTLVKDESLWLSQKSMAQLFDCSVDNVALHLKNIFQSGELSEKSVAEDFSVTASDGKNYRVKHYNLDAIISVGYRVNSSTATQFRIWATQRLREYIIKGFTMDDERLKNAGGGNYWKELLERIRDIRSSEKVLYRQVLDLYATSVDYDVKSQDSKKFFAIVQNKLHYAANGKTAAELVSERADAEKPFMGLMNFGGNGVSKADIAVAKNYLKEKEIKRLNNIVSAYFDIAELRALDEKQTTMQDYIKQLDKLIASMDREVLKDAGKVSHIEAEAKAHAEYKKYQVKTLSQVEKDYLQSIKAIEKKITKKLYV